MHKVYVALAHVTVPFHFFPLARLLQVPRMHRVRRKSSYFHHVSRESIVYSVCFMRLQCRYTAHSFECCVSGFRYRHSLPTQPYSFLSSESFVVLSWKLFLGKAADCKLFPSSDLDKEIKGWNINPSSVSKLHLFPSTTLGSLSQIDYLWGLAVAKPMI